MRKKEAKRYFNGLSITTLKIEELIKSFKEKTKQIENRIDSEEVTKPFLRTLVIKYLELKTIGSKIADMLDNYDFSNNAIKKSVKKIIAIAIVFVLLHSAASALTFPIDDEYCLHRNGKILLTGWYYEKRGNRLHSAVDVPANVHTPIRAVKAGKIIEKGFGYSRSNIQQAYGNYIKILDDGGFTWIYAHLNDYNVKIDELIQEGQIIGTVGWTGLVLCAPHLHLEKRNKNGKKIFYTKDFKIDFALRRGRK